MRVKILGSGLAVALLAASTSVSAATDNAELWFAPKVTVAIDDDTAVELDTQARFRDNSVATDTYYARVSVIQKLSDVVTVSAGIEARNNSRGLDETRLLQQLALKKGIWRARFRFEQRFVETSRMALRVRGRGGVAVPIDAAKRWTAFGDAEAMFTLRATSGGSDGLTGIRTQVGVSHKLSGNAAISLAYLRNQDRRRGRPDAVGHAPILGLDLSF